MWCDHLVDVVQLEVFEEHEEKPWDGLDDDLFVSVHVDAQLHGLQHRGSEGKD